MAASRSDMVKREQRLTVDYIIIEATALKTVLKDGPLTSGNTKNLMERVDALKAALVVEKGESSLSAGGKVT